MKKHVTNKDEAYRGYLFKHNAIHEVWYVQRDGVTITTCVPIETTRIAVDSVLGPREGTS